VFIRELPGRRFVYGFPSLDGATVKLAVHHEGATVDPDAVPRDIGDDDLQPLRTFAAERLRGVEPTAVRAITCLYTNTPDEHFVVDHLPQSPAVTVVSACSGHGFKFAPAIGEIAAGLALDSATPHDISRFALRRFGRGG
jgi:sarcosine oxidase